MGNRIWGDRIREYENLNTLELLETIENLKIKNNELQSALTYEKQITDVLNKTQNMTCEMLGKYTVENHNLREMCERYEKIINKPLTIDDVKVVANPGGCSVYLAENVKLTEFYKNAKHDPSDPRD